MSTVAMLRTAPQFCVRRTALLARTLSARAKRRRESMHAARDTGAKLPALDQKLKALYLRVHPDRFTASPKAKEINEASLAMLTGFLDSIQDLTDGYPPATSVQLRFCLHRDADADATEHTQSSIAATAIDEADIEDGLGFVRAELRTTGGDCSKQVRGQLTSLFRSCGVVPPEFEWHAAGAEPKYWCTSRRSQARREERADRAP